mgnify:CR=1 FL=1
MARIIGRTLGKLIAPLTSGEITGTNDYQAAHNVASKLHRASIFWRQKQQFNHSTEAMDKSHRWNIDHEDQDVRLHPRTPHLEPGSYTSGPSGKEKKPHTENIFIYDLDFDPARDAVTRGAEKIRLTSVPREVDFDPDTNLVGLFSIARNNPRYHYTGAEDTVTIELDWFADSTSMEEVIFNCRWLEMMSKGNGYDDTVHRVKLIWGNDDALWAHQQFVIASAPYKLRNWNAGYYNGDKYISTKMVPRGATQTLTLKRISDNNMGSSTILGTLGRNLQGSADILAHLTN